MRITTAAQAARRDADAIASGVESWTLMHAAGSAIAACITEQFPLADTAHVFAGTGNNGGDAYVVAAILWAAGMQVFLSATGEPGTTDAMRARALFEIAQRKRRPVRGQRQNVAHMLAIDGVLGTGQHGPLRAPAAGAAAQLNDLRLHGATVIALDLPTGVDATTGEVAQGAVRAHHTMALGTMKRAHVLQREQCGAVSVLDIGLGGYGEGHDDAWLLADEPMLKAAVPPVSWSAHKGTRGRLAIVGGAQGMAGAIVLACEAAVRSGAGLVHAHVDPASVLALQIGVPQAITHPWQHQPVEVQAVAVGPGFGRSGDSAQALHALIGSLSETMATTPIVLDADALTLIGADTARIAALGATRDVVCTPHPGEFARLLGEPVAAALADRIAQVMAFAARSRATILLKGTPTVVAGPNSALPVVVPRGTAVLATGGSGDMLTGIIGALLAQGASGANAAAVGAWVHGRAAEIATEHAGTVRGVTLRDVLHAFPGAWRALQVTGDTTLPVLAHLPRVWSDDP